MFFVKEMPFCFECGAEIVPDDPFCGSCGIAQVPVAAIPSGPPTLGDEVVVDSSSSGSVEIPQQAGLASVIGFSSTELPGEDVFDFETRHRARVARYRA